LKIRGQQHHGTEFHLNTEFWNVQLPTMEIPSGNSQSDPISQVPEPSSGLSPTSKTQATTNNDNKNNGAQEGTPRVKKSFRLADTQEAQDDPGKLT
jgi:hypothetical protein